MKKFLPILLILSLVFCSFISVSAEGTTGLLSEADYGFEGVASVSDTSWYKLFNAYGNSKSSDELYNDIEIKTDGGHTGDNYISMTTVLSWYSPSINVYPAISSAGEDSYIIAFWYRSSSKLDLKHICIRGLASDAYEDPGEYMPDLVAQSNGNYYGFVNGKSTEADANGWRLFVSNAFDVVEEQFDGDHNWWFCVDQLPATADNPLTLDIDDFYVGSELEFELPESAQEKEIVTEITYLTEDVKANAITPSKTDTPPTEPTPTPIVEEPQGGIETSSVLIIAAVALVAGAIIAGTVVMIVKKKKK